MIAVPPRAQALDPDVSPEPKILPLFLHEVFEGIARRVPDQGAVDLPGAGSQPRRSFTYAEIDALADALAARLAPFVTGESVVAILLPRSSHLVYVAQLAVMKAGGAYTCIEPGTPPERARFILEDSRAVAAIADSGAAEMRGLRYSRFIHGLRLAGIIIDRKSLAEIAIHDPETFDAITERVRSEVEKADAAVASRSRALVTA